MTTTSWTPGRPRFTHTQRRQILTRDPICVHCHQREATVADHIIPIAEHGPNTTDNGQGLCRGCHNTKTAAERNRGLARRTTPPRTRPPERHPGLT